MSNWLTNKTSHLSIQQSFFTHTVSNIYNTSRTYVRRAKLTRAKCHSAVRQLNLSPSAICGRSVLIQMYVNRRTDRKTGVLYRGHALNTLKDASRSGPLPSESGLTARHRFLAIALANGRLSRPLLLVPSTCSSPPRRDVFIFVPLPWWGGTIESRVVKGEKRTGRVVVCDVGVVEVRRFLLWVLWGFRNGDTCLGNLIVLRMFSLNVVGGVCARCAVEVLLKF